MQSALSSERDAAAGAASAAAAAAVTPAPSNEASQASEANQAPDAAVPNIARPGAAARALGWLQGGMRIAARLAYPVVILCAWRWDNPRYVGCMLFALLWLQRWGGSGTVANSLRRLTPVDWCVAGLLNVASAAIVFTDSELLLRLYPSLVNLGLLVAFGATLVRGPSMIEKFARMTMPDPPAHVIRYTRRVTQVWCAFFVLNGAFSVYTALYWRRETWSLYNGAIAYGLIGVLLIGEIAWRRWIMLPRAARAGLS